MIIILFLIAITVGYTILYNNTKNSHQQETKILFYKIQNETSKLLTYLNYRYELQKLKLLAKHQIALNYLHTHSYHDDLTKLYQKLNHNTPNKPYNIYITDKNLVISNSTFKKDLGFDLSFAKKGFDADRKAQRIGISTPIFEKSSKSFLSYTNSYLPGDEGKRILQVSYNYPDVKPYLTKIQKTIEQYPTVQDVKVYLFTNSGFINDIIFTDYDTYKPDIQEIRSRINEGKLIQKKLHKESLETEFFTKNAIPYKAMYLSSKSVISHNTYMVYSILFNETDYLNQLKNFNIFMGVMTLLGLIAIFVVSKIRTKELRLTEQDHFVKSSMHEIRTPLSVITLNNEMRQRELGNDEYTSEIESALKTLQNSYDDMSYIVTQNKIDYPKEIINLASLVESRIAYFQAIALSNDKTIITHIHSQCHVHVSTTELTRLIDNNLSNAIKYADKKTHITITLNDNILSFHSFGATIQDTKKVFHKYVRENSVVGGYGLGLSIVKDIADRYNIDIDLRSSTTEGTYFTYHFKCHTNVTQEI